MDEMDEMNGSDEADRGAQSTPSISSILSTPVPHQNCQRRWPPSTGISVPVM
jgi:hypothetical protein